MRNEEIIGNAESIVLISNGKRFLFSNPKITQVSQEVLGRHIDIYFHCEDFKELKEDKMNFQEAYKELLNYKKIKSCVWDDGFYVRRFDCRIVDEEGKSSGKVKTAMP